MSEPSEPDAGTLRNWMRIDDLVDAAVENPERLGVARLATRKAWRLMGYLYVRNCTSAYAAAMKTCRLPSNTMSRLVRLLLRVGYIERVGKTGSSQELRLTIQGRTALGHVLYPKKPAE